MGPEEFFSWQGTPQVSHVGGREPRVTLGFWWEQPLQQDFWLKERNILSSGTQKLPILNSFTFTYTNIEIPCLSPKLERDLWNGGRGSLYDGQIGQGAVVLN